MNRDQRFALGQELEAKQTLLDQLRALAAQDRDFLTDLLDTPTRREPCSSRETFLVVRVNLDEIWTERNSFRDNGVDYASVVRNHECQIHG